MRSSLLAFAFVAAASACKTDTTAPVAGPTFRVVADVTGSNNCSVNTLNKSYSSIGQIRGDVPTKFIGTLADKSYHGFGCWVATDGGDADLIVVFSGNSFGKPLAVGTYGLRLDLLDDTPPMMASIRFYTASLGNDELRPLDNAVGSVVVDSSASGARRIHVDVQATRWYRGF